jgi:hypothetical protein
MGEKLGSSHQGKTQIDGVLEYLDLRGRKWQEAGEDYASSNMRVFPKVSGLPTWSQNCKWSLPLDAVVSLFYQSV